MSKRRGTRDVKVDVDESKKAKQDPSNEESKKEKPLKSTVEADQGYLQIIITGPRKCGKSSLVCSFMGHLFPPKQGEFLSKQYLHVVQKDSLDKYIMIWDLDSRDEFTAYRRESYKEADIALLCFDVELPEDHQEGNEHRLENLLHPWIVELDNYCGDIPIILVGLKKDLKNIQRRKNRGFFSDDDIRNVKERWPRIESHVEVSAQKEREGVVGLFSSAVTRITVPKPKIVFTNSGFELGCDSWFDLTSV